MSDSQYLRRCHWCVHTRHLLISEVDVHARHEQVVHIDALVLDRRRDIEGCSESSLSRRRARRMECTHLDELGITGGTKERGLLKKHARELLAYEMISQGTH